MTTGKSTQVPQYVADDFPGYRGPDVPNDAPVRICCTQPRRVAAQMIARRVAEEYMTDIGDLVGFRVGSKGRSREDCENVTSTTRIEFVTEGE